MEEMKKEMLKFNYICQRYVSIVLALEIYGDILRQIAQYKNPLEQRIFAIQGDVSIK